jgi:hypothetical protein
MKHIGTVVSDLEGPSSSKLSFVIKENQAKMPVRKGQLVQLETEEGLLIARVDEIVKTNRYYIRAEAVREYERSGKPLNHLFPIDRWEYLMAHATPLGVWSDGEQRRVTFPPSPGQKVFRARDDVLAGFFGLDPMGLRLGELVFHDTEVKLNLTRLFQKHLAILAMSGAGKSNLASVMIEEVLDRPAKLGKPALIVVDPHGEYSGFAAHQDYATKVKVFGRQDICIAASKLTPSKLIEFLPKLTAVQKRELAPIIDGLRGSYGFEDLINAVDKSDVNPKTKLAIVSWLEDLRATRLFGRLGSPSLQELARCGQLSVLDLSDFVRLREKQIVVAHFCRELFDARRARELPPFILFIEEAHQFAPEGVERGRAISRAVIEQIAREGRKFNACLVLISQRPIRLSTTALSQANSMILMRIMNPYDLDHVGRSCEGVTREMLKLIPGLRVGEAFVVGEAVNHPLMVRIRRSRIGSCKEGKLEDVLLELARQQEDLNAFK